MGQVAGLVAVEVPRAERVNRPALLVVDMQNDFVRAGAPQEVPDARRTFDAINQLIARFRDLGRPVIFTRFMAEEEPGLMWLWSRECQPDVRSCWKGQMRRYRDDPEERDGSGIVAELDWMSWDKCRCCPDRARTEDI